MGCYSRVMARDLEPPDSKTLREEVVLDEVHRVEPSSEAQENLRWLLRAARTPHIPTWVISGAMLKDYLIGLAEDDLRSAQTPLQVQWAEQGLDCLRETSEESLVERHWVQVEHNRRNWAFGAQLPEDLGLEFTEDEMRMMFKVRSSGP